MGLKRLAERAACLLLYANIQIHSGQKKTPLLAGFYAVCGESGIRTRGTIARTAV